MIQDTRIEAQESPRDHFTMLPNLVDDLDLDPYAFRLYCHLRRVVGESGGTCWQSTATLAEACHMSAGKISQAKQTLAHLGLIVIEKCQGAGGLHDHVTLVDLWHANHQYYDDLTPESVHPVNAMPSPDERIPPSVHEMNAMRSPGETKKNPLKKTVVDDEAARAEAISPGSPESSSDPVLAVVHLYEQEIGGTITPFVLDDITDLVEHECRDLERWRAAFRASVGARNRWSYVKAVILHPERKPPAQEVSRGSSQPPSKRGRRPATASPRFSTPTDDEIAELNRAAEERLRAASAAGPGR